MMVRLRGLEEWAEENNNEALFLTLTAPSSFHAGNGNKKWSGVNPRDTQNYLNKVWQQFRALLAKRDIKFYGMRVAEPHKDGTPHWHALA
ncbi:replication endonuclease, partial [Escherichia coli]